MGFTEILVALYLIENSKSNWKIKRGEIKIKHEKGETFTVKSNHNKCVEHSIVVRGTFPQFLC